MCRSRGGRIIVPFPRAVLLTSGIAILWGLALAPAHAQIPPGYEVIRLTDDPDFDDRPAINNYGQVVWSKRIDQDGDQEEIFFWDGVQVHRITDNNVRDAFPDINDHGTMVWSQSIAPGEFENFEIAMLRDGRMTLLTDNDVSDRSPSVNNLDHIAWSQRSGRGCHGLHLMYYDGTVTSQITDDELGNQSPEINNSDEIAWVAYDDCANPWVSTIKVFSNGGVIELTDGDSSDQGAVINNRSQVAWQKVRTIVLWEHGETREITNSGRVPEMNNAGHIAFTRFNQDLSIPEQWLWVEGEFAQLSDPGVPSARGAINDCGEVSWWFGDVPNLDLLLMRMKPGDATHDGFVSSADFRRFDGCLSGPRNPDAACSGHESDVDRDGDVDLRDFVLREPDSRELEEMVDLIECMTGPMDLDEFCACRAMDIDHDRDVDLRDFALLQQVFAEEGQP